MAKIRRSETIAKQETVAITAQRTIDRALTDGINATPALRQTRSTSSPGEGTLSGYYDDDDNFISYWRAGMPVGSAPIDPKLGY